MALEAQAVPPSHAEDEEYLKPSRSSFSVRILDRDDPQILPKDSDHCFALAHMGSCGQRRWCLKVKVDAAGYVSIVGDWWSGNSITVALTLAAASSSCFSVAAFATRAIRLTIAVKT